MFRRVLIANRGVIACRIIRTLRRMGIRSVAVYSAADRQSMHVLHADEAVEIGPPPAAESYLNAAALLAAARDTGAEAIHPGYGFLSENADFAAACEARGIAFIGPRPEQIEAFGLKHRARELAVAAGVPLLPGTGLLADVNAALAAADRLGFPVMLKSTAGGGGIGMRLVRRREDLAEAFEGVERLARASFREPGLYLERYVDSARHVEVQIMGDGQGRVIALGDRDCSIQRRNQKVLEETPAPNLDEKLRRRMHSTAVKLAESVNYRSAGTVEFLLDVARGQFHFLEVNTRLQVEHGVTEEVTGLDLVEIMVRIAAGEPRVLERIRPVTRGAAMQVRLYAEDPARGFQPSAGTLTDLRFPTQVRVETWVERGTEVTPWYDPMLAKIIARGDNRHNALARLAAALQGARVSGIETNLAWLRQVISEPAFVAGLHHTRMLEDVRWQPPVIEVLESGVQSSIQDWPGRTGYWDVGVPPSGPMDEYAFRVANALVGNQRGGASANTAALECAMAGPTLRFGGDAVIAITGAPCEPTLDGEPLAMWESHAVRAGSVLRMGRIPGPGCRTYLAVSGGFDVPAYLGSRATFMLGRFGGHAGRSLRAGDILHIGDNAGAMLHGAAAAPGYGQHWELGVLIGPHAAPDFFTDEDIHTLFSATWTVHYNSSRTGIRLVGPKPTWARADGGEAGLHPSNIHDNAYAIGAIDFTGDMPLILGPDGPSLGGFVCPAVVVRAELWKLGQLRPGDTVRFRELTTDGAAELAHRLEQAIEMLEPPPSLDDLPARLRVDRTAVATPSPLSPVLVEQAGTATATGQVPMTIRQSGDCYVLVEYGPPVLDLGLRLRVHALMQALRDARLPGIIDLTPGIRSLQVHFDPQRLPRERLMQTLRQLDGRLATLDDIEVPSRIVHLPLSWDDPSTRLAIEKYMQSVRADAPWCPSNLEFIRRINGLDSIDEVRDIVFGASWLVLGLGDVYLGAPVATPLDPRHRLVTTKYNPARTWTPENAVGIGGAYLCIYGMEGPGGYQFVGRTLQVWNRYRVTPDFEAGKPWLLRFFDQIRFFPVSEAELARLREDFPAGRYRLRVEQGRFSLRQYREFLEREASSIAAFKQRQQAAFEAERERWRAAGENLEAQQDRGPSSQTVRQLPDKAQAVASTVPGSVWKVLKRPGDAVAAQEAVMVIESMKMEFPVLAPVAGRVLDVLCREGTSVTAGQDVVLLEPQ